MTWDKIVKSVLGMVDQDIHYAQSAKRKTKGPVLKKETTEALKTIVRIAETRMTNFFLHLPFIAINWVNLSKRRPEIVSLYKRYYGTHHAGPHRRRLPAQHFH